jgi:phosphonate transport system substrate-binding protein
MKLAATRHYAVACIALAIAFTSSLSPFTAANAQEGTLKVGIIPYDAPSKLKEQYTPFANYLSTKTHMPAKLFIAQDYVGVAEALQADQIDCAYLNPLSYVLFVQRMKGTPERLIPVAMPEVHGSLYYYGVIVTRKDTGIRTIPGLKGKKMAFSEPTSTSGYLYPFQYMMAHGINPKRDLGQEVFAGTPAVIPALLNHEVDAGAVFEEGLAMFTHSTAERNSLYVLARVGPIANGMLVIRGNVPPAEIHAIEVAMAQINTDPQGKAANAALQVTKWDKANDSVFNPVRQAANILGLKLESMDTKK